MSLTIEAPRRTPWHLRPVALLAVWCANRLAGLPPVRLRRILERLARGARPSTPDEAAHARNAVIAVSVRCRGNFCLQRSIATVLLARLGGHFPDWRTGVRTFPFRAHAWVEAGGAPVDENAVEIDAFAVTMAVSARG